MSGPLAGVRVVVLAGMGPTPFASMLLADMGADVVRICRPPGRARQSGTPADAMTAEQDIVNRGVTSVAVDLKDPAGVERVLELVGRAEVFIEGFRPGAAERLGLGPEALLAARPNLVYARLTGYGQSGPLALEAGHDLNYVAQSGALSALGRKDEAPHAPINLLGDYAGGGALAAFGIVCAVLEARRSGLGQVIDSAMADGVALLTSKIQGLRAAGLFSDERGTNFIDTGAPYYDTYLCADGKYLAVGAIEPHFYQEFISRLGVETSGWPGQDERASWPQLREVIGAAVGAKTRDEWAAVYAGSDACVTPVLNFEEAAQHPHNAERGMYQRVAGVLHPAPSPRFSRTPARAPQAPSQRDVDVPELLSRWDAQENTTTPVDTDRKGQS
ncbi:CaiB/BaiF CoA transferase family protein [Arthrobacter sp. MA-N2]|uniref:CaiB/BaiF CoA transferase family protein n=1 Tax=Arthrobacter sp. MA-N2 TaxID=1101188 RepID=UPI0006842EB6|nr:CaiB/BaiF CoA-transferase family protein [Arthrobacter sp. MA-N2]